MKYDTFGKLISSTGALLPRFRYTGKLFDDTIELQWSINRWYDAHIGRWVSEDPIGFRGNDLNLLRYVKNMVIVRYDPLGLDTLYKVPDIPWTGNPNMEPGPALKHVECHPNLALRETGEKEIEWRAILFVSLMQYYKEHGSREFTMGMAPLSGVIPYRNAPLVQKFGVLLY